METGVCGRITDRYHSGWTFKKSQLMTFHPEPFISKTTVALDDGDGMEYANKIAAPRCISKVT